MYVDFCLRIEGLDDARVKVNASSPAGECSAVATVPLSFRLSSQRWWSGSRKSSRDIVPESENNLDESPQQIGAELFQCLFPPAVLSLWDRTLGAPTGQETPSVSVKIQIDLRTSGNLILASLPWELLYHEPSGGFLALDNRTPIVRYLEVSKPIRRFSRPSTWRILVIAPRPSGVEELDLDLEIAELRAALSEESSRPIGDEEGVRNHRVTDPPSFELVVAKKATVQGIRDELTRQRIHSIHFMGHGMVDDETGAGGLVLERPGEGIFRLSGAHLAALLRGLDPPSLFVLNGCWTGRLGALDTSPFASSAAALVQAGVPAVVAMQLPIGDQEAICFSGRLVACLIAGHSLEWAVSEARQSLQFRDYDGYSWAIPALFTRVSDGRLVDPAPSGLEDSGVQSHRDGSSVRTLQPDSDSALLITDDLTAGSIVVYAPETKSQRGPLVEAKRTKADVAEIGKRQVTGNGTD